MNVVLISPNGEHLVWLENDPAGTALYSQTLGGDERTMLVRSQNIEGKIEWFDWASDDLLLAASFPSLHSTILTRS